MAMKKIFPLISLIMLISCGIAYAIGPAPITISGFIFNKSISSITITATAENGRVIKTDQATIIYIEPGTEYYRMTITADDSDTSLFLALDFMKDGDIERRVSYKDAKPWDLIAINLSFEDNEGASEEKTSSINKRPNSAANEEEMQAFATQHNNATYIKRKFDVDIPITEQAVHRSTVEQPQQVYVSREILNTDNIWSIILFMSFVAGIVSLEFYARNSHHKK